MSDRFERFWQFQLGATECAICLDILSQPRLLSCLHTFCLSCLDQLHHTTNNNGDLICPTCRAATVVPSDGASGLRANFIVDQLLEFRRLCDVTCSACVDSSSSSSAVAVATAYCADCGDNLCENCVTAHRRIRALKSHRLVEIGTTNDDAHRLKELLCNRPEHCSEHPNQELALYCTDCSTSICLSCCVLAHRMHGYVDIREQANEGRKELERVMNSVSEKLSDFRRESGELELRLTTGNASATQTLNEITRRTEEFIARVRTEETGLIETIQRHQHQFQTEIETLLEKIQTKIAAIENFLLLCQKLRDVGTHSEVIRLSSPICATADELRAATDFAGVALPSLVVIPPSGCLSELNVLGEVAVIKAEGESGRDMRGEDLSKCDTDRMEDGGRVNPHPPSKCVIVSAELSSSLRRDNDDRAADRFQSTASIADASDSVAHFAEINASEKARASLLCAENSYEESCLNITMSSNPSTILTASRNNDSEDDFLPKVEVHRSSETQANYCSISSSSSISSISSSASLVSISDVSSADQSEDDDNGDIDSGHLARGRRSFHDDGPRSRNAAPLALPPIPLFPVSDRYSDVSRTSRRRGSADIETIPGAEPVVGLALLDRFLFVLRRNAKELELYDQKSLHFVGRESMKDDDVWQPTGLTACARSHTLYIGHTRRIVFSVKVSDSTTTTTRLSLRKLAVASNYAHLSTTYNCGVLMGCPKAGQILEYRAEPNWKLVRCIQLHAGAYPNGIVQLSPNRFAVSSKMNVVYIITEEGPRLTCQEVPVPHNMSHMATDIGGNRLLVADCYGHQIRRLEPNCLHGKARSSPILKTKTISRPCRLWTDTVGRRLFVGTTQGDVKVLRLD